MSKDTVVIIMAAGKGKRMKSSLPKVLHKIMGRTLLENVVLTANKLDPVKIIVIVGFNLDMVRNTMQQNLNETIYEKIEWVEQKDQLGTGDAVKQCIPVLKNFDGNALILSGDVPLLTAETLEELMEYHLKEKAVATILTNVMANPAGYGRILRTSRGSVIGIVEDKDAMSEERSIKEINTGTYCFDWQSLNKVLPSLRDENAQGEYYLTDVIHILSKGGQHIGGYKSSDEIESMGISNKNDLAAMTEIVQKRINSYWMEYGVIMIDPKSVYIDHDCVIGQDTIIYPNTLIQGKSRIGQNSEIGPSTQLIDAIIGNEVKIKFSLITKSTILDKTEVGPFAHLRMNTSIGSNCRVGNFVEIKNTIMHDNVKSAHLTYLGDSELGSYTNIGAGTITCNYDGFKKHRTKMGEKVFIGSNSTLVAPVNLADNTYVAAGSVITEDVPEGALAIGRGKQVNKDGWVEKYRDKNKK